MLYVQSTSSWIIFPCHSRQSVIWVPIISVVVFSLFSSITITVNLPSVSVVIIHWDIVNVESCSFTLCREFLMKIVHSRVVVEAGADEVKIGICHSADKLICRTPDAWKFQIWDSLEPSVCLGIGSYGMHDGDHLQRHFPWQKNMTRCATRWNPCIVCAASTSHYHQCYPPPMPSTSSRHTRYFITSPQIVSWHSHALQATSNCDIFQVQLIPQSNPVILPTVLPPPITNFLGASLGKSTNVIDDGCVDWVE